jgi:hypothetical protein
MLPSLPRPLPASLSSPCSLPPLSLPPCSVARSASLFLPGRAVGGLRLRVGLADLTGLLLCGLLGLLLRAGGDSSVLRLGLPDGLRLWDCCLQ